MKKIYEKSMGKFTIRLDEKHLKILGEIMETKNLNSRSEAIRYLIEKEDKSKKEN